MRINDRRTEISCSRIIGFVPFTTEKFLLNLLDLKELTVDDVMIPHGKIEYLDLEEDDEVLTQQIATSFHSRLLVVKI